MKNGLIMHIEKEIVSKPYIDLTIGMMAECGVHAKWEGSDIVVKPQSYNAIDMSVEADWTAASYWYEIASLLPGSEIKLLGVKENSMQGDAYVANLFVDLGVTTEYITEGIIIRSQKKKQKNSFIIS